MSAALILCPRILIDVLLAACLSLFFGGIKYLFSLIGLGDAPVFRDFLCGGIGILLILLYLREYKGVQAWYHAWRDPIFRQMTISTGISWDNYKRLRDEEYSKKDRKEKTYANLVEELGTCSCGIAQILIPHSPNPPQNLDCWVWEVFGFLLAFLHEQDGISSEEAQLCIIGLSETYPQSLMSRRKQAVQETGKAMKFYSHWLFAMNRTKAHTMPDVVVYNLTRPGTRIGFEDMPLFCIDILETTRVWAQINDFLAEDAIPRLNKALQKLDNEQ